MNKTVVLIFLSSVLLSSCGGADPVKYNDSLVNYHNEADGYVSDFNDKASNLLKEGKQSELPGYAKNTIENLKNCIGKVESLEKPKDSEAFHRAVIDYMNALVGSVDTMGREYSLVTDSTNEAGFDKLETIIGQSQKERAAKNEAVIEAQADFARKHDIKITKGEDK